MLASFLAEILLIDNWLQSTEYSSVHFPPHENNHFFISRLCRCTVSVMSQVLPSEKISHVQRHKTPYNAKSLKKKKKNPVFWSNAISLPVFIAH